jgi:hypothetical protein
LRQSACSKDGSRCCTAIKLAPRCTLPVR